MPKRISKKPAKQTRTRRDSNQIAFATVQKTIEASETVEQPEFDKVTISAVMSALGRIGGKKGGVNRMAKLTDKEKTELALKAAKVRWAKEKGKKR